MLECKNISVVYGRKIRAVSELSLEVRRGEIVVLIGANGAGKSTLLKTISGLLRAESGEIRFEGETIRHRPAHEIAALGIAHVPEGRRIFPGLTVMENLELGFYLKKGTSGKGWTPSTPFSRSLRKGVLKPEGPSRAENSRCWPWRAL